MKIKQMGSSLLLGLLVFALLLSAMGVQAAQPQPLAAPTPVSEPRGAIPASVVEFAAGRVITADVRLGCIDSTAANKLDVYYQITAGTVNTATIKMQHRNVNPGAPSASFADGMNVITGVVTDTVGMQQVQAFGAWTCVFVDVTNANAITATVNAMIK